MHEAHGGSHPYFRVQGYQHQRMAMGSNFQVVSRMSQGWRCYWYGLWSAVNMVMIRNDSVYLEVRHGIRFSYFGQSSDD